MTKNLNHHSHWLTAMMIALMKSTIMIIVRLSDLAIAVASLSKMLHSISLVVLSPNLRPSISDLGGRRKIATCARRTIAPGPRRVASR